MKSAAGRGMLATMRIVHRGVIVFGCAVLGACTGAPERDFASFLSRIDTTVAPAPGGGGPPIWTTETTVWQDDRGYARTVSCTALRSSEWFIARGYRPLPGPEAAAGAGLVLKPKVHSATTADVSVGPPNAPPEAIYSFFREDDEWQLAGVEIIRRETAVAPGALPAYRCAATEP